MTRESARNGTNATKLETVLAELNKLEACTARALEIVREILGVHANSKFLDVDPSHSRTKKAAASNVRRTTQVNKDDARGRSAVKIIKTCLKVFDGEVASNTKLKQSGTGARASLKSNRDKHYAVLAEICQIAFTAWSVSVDIKKLIDVAMTRTNFVTRLLDAELVNMVPREC